MTGEQLHVFLVYGEMTLVVRVDRRHVDALMRQVEPGDLMRSPWGTFIQHERPLGTTRYKYQQQRNTYAFNKRNGAGCLISMSHL